VGSLGVVDLDEGVEKVLEFVDGVGFRFGGEPFLEGLVEPFDLAAGLGVERPRVGGVDADLFEVAGEQVRGERCPVVGKDPGGDAVDRNGFDEGVPRVGSAGCPRNGM